MKNGFRSEVTEGCREITPDGEKEKLRQIINMCGAVVQSKILQAFSV